MVVDSSAAVGVKCCLEHLPCLWVGKRLTTSISVTWCYDCCEKGAVNIRDPIHLSLSPALIPCERWSREASPGAAAL